MAESAVQGRSKVWRQAADVIGSSAFLARLELGISTMRLGYHVHSDPTQEPVKPSDLSIATSPPSTPLNASHLQLRFKWRGSRPLFSKEQPPSSSKVSGLPARQNHPELLRKRHPAIVFPTNRPEEPRRNIRKADDEPDWSLEIDDEDQSDVEALAIRKRQKRYRTRSKKRKAGSAEHVADEGTLPATSRSGLQLDANSDDDDDNDEDNDIDDDFTDEPSGGSGGGGKVQLAGGVYPMRCHPRMLRAALLDDTAKSQKDKTFADLINLCANAEILAVSTTINRTLQIYLERILAQSELGYIFRFAVSTKPRMQEIFRSAAAILTPSKRLAGTHDREQLEGRVLDRCMHCVKPTASVAVGADILARLRGLPTDLLHRAAKIKNIDIAMLESANIVLHDEGLPPLMPSLNVSLAFSTARKFVTALVLFLRDKRRLIKSLSQFADTTIKNMSTEWPSSPENQRETFLRCLTGFLMQSTSGTQNLNSTVLEAIEEVSLSRPNLKPMLLKVTQDLLARRRELVPSDEAHTLENVVYGRAKGVSGDFAVPFFGQLGYRICIVST